MDYVALIVACFTVVLVLLVGFLVIPAIFKVRHPEKHYGGPVYRVKLMSITKDISVRSDLSREQNLINAKREVVDEIIVQQTSSDDFYREILTGKLIPVATLRMKDNCYIYDNFNNVIFVEWIHIYSKKGEISHTIVNPLEKVSSEILSKYIEERQDNSYMSYPSFAQYLDSIFNDAENLYSGALERVEKSEEKKIAELLKKIENNKITTSKKSGNQKTSSISETEPLSEAFRSKQEKKSILIRSSMNRRPNDTKSSMLVYNSTNAKSNNEDSEDSTIKNNFDTQELGSLHDFVNIHGELEASDTTDAEDQDNVDDSSFEDETDSKYCENAASIDSEGNNTEANDSDSIESDSDVESDNDAVEGANEEAEIYEDSKTSEDSEGSEYSEDVESSEDNDIKIYINFDKD